MEMVELTMVDGTREQAIFVNPENVTWVQPIAAHALPTPITEEKSSDANGSGAVLHLVGQPTLPVTVRDSVDEVREKLEAAA